MGSHCEMVYDGYKHNISDLGAILKAHGFDLTCQLMAGCRGRRNGGCMQALGAAC